MQRKVQKLSKELMELQRKRTNQDNLLQMKLEGEGDLMAQNKAYRAQIQKMQEEIAALRGQV